MPKDLSINEISFESVILIKSWPDTLENITSIISDYFESQSLPKVGEFQIQKNTYIAALSPGHYMIISQHQDLIFKLSKIITPENAAIIDVSHSRYGLSLKGTNASHILNKEIAIDLSSKTMPELAVIQTEIHSIGVILFKFTTEDYLIFCYKSFFKSLYEWLIDSLKDQDNIQ